MNDHDKITDKLAKDLMSIHSCGFTQDEIIEMARQAARSENSRLLGCGIDDLKAFAKLAAAKAGAKERERLASIAEKNGNDILAMQLRGQA
jgi:hypothetical protein